MNILIPVSWLRDYLKTDAAAKTIARELSLSGPSVERIKKNKEDFIFDIEVTTNRLDAFSVVGIAREANAILNYRGLAAKLVLPQKVTSLDPDTKDKLSLSVLVKDSNLCPRFAAIVLSGVKIGPSPALVQNRLEKSGIRPINNIVDITNYVMLETGNPMHAFDYDKIKGAKMTLRKSQKGEKLTTLDGQKLEVPEGSIVIEDAKRLIDLCGIMGAENSQITKRTRNVVFFVQVYNPAAIRKTTMALAKRTEASLRFEKGIDPHSALPALSRAVFLAKKMTGAKIASELIDIFPKKPQTKTISLNFDKLERYLGIQIPQKDVEQILSLLGFKVQTLPKQVVATPPSWRISDTESDVDLIEEVARIWGYHNLPSTLPSGEIPRRENSILKNVIEIKNFLKDLGLTEVMTYSIVSKSILEKTAVPEKTAVELANPLSEEWQFMRPSLIPSLVEVFQKNQNNFAKMQIFETARTYIKQKNGLPKQELFLSAIQTGADFYQIKGLAENIFEYLCKKATYSKIETEDALFQKEEAAVIKIGDQEVGKIGVLKGTIDGPQEATQSLAALEINLSLVYSLPSKTNIYHPIPKYPPVVEDISAIFNLPTPVAAIISEVKKTSILVKKVEILDIWQDEKIGTEKKSVTLRVYFQKPNETPSQEEVASQREAIIKNLEKNLRSKVRR